MRPAVGLVDREEAARFVSGKVTTNDVRPFARTVIAMAQCIDLLDDGYEANVHDDPPTWNLRQRTLVNVPLPYEVPMTPEQVVVMTGVNE